MAFSKEFLSVEETAEWTGIPAEVIKQAAEDGELPALVVLGHVRIRRDSVLSMITSRPRRSEGSHSSASPDGAAPTDGLPMPESMAWLEELSEADAFIHKWPDGYKENYFKVWVGSISLAGKPVEVKVGEATRHDRGRLTVFIDGTAIAESVDTLDGSSWASMIKPDSRHVLEFGQTPPPLYRNARIESYREATGMKGIGVPGRGAAVVVRRDDLRSAAHHAAARWLARRGFNVVPARGDK